MTGSAKQSIARLRKSGLLPPTRKDASADSCPAKLAQRAETGRRFAPRNDEWQMEYVLAGLKHRLHLRCRFLGDEHRLQIIEQLHLDAIAVHDQALLQDRKQIVPRPVDDKTCREADQHEGEDQRHPAED